MPEAIQHLVQASLVHTLSAGSADGLASAVEVSMLMCRLFFRHAHPCRTVTVACYSMKSVLTALRALGQAPGVMAAAVFAAPDIRQGLPMSLQVCPNDRACESCCHIKLLSCRC